MTQKEWRQLRPGDIITPYSSFIDSSGVTYVILEPTIRFGSEGFVVGLVYAPDEDRNRRDTDFASIPGYWERVTL